MSPSAAGPSAVSLSAVSPSAAGPSAAGPSAAHLSAAGLSAAGPCAVRPPLAQPPHPAADPPPPCPSSAALCAAPPATCPFPPASPAAAARPPLCPCSASLHAPARLAMSPPWPWSPAAECSSQGHPKVCELTVICNLGLLTESLDSFPITAPGPAVNATRSPLLGLAHPLLPVLTPLPPPCSGSAFPPQPVLATQLSQGFEPHVA